MIAIPEGTFHIGTNQPDGFPTDNEGPKITIQHPAFMIYETTVTNKEFASLRKLVILPKQRSLVGPLFFIIF